MACHMWLRSTRCRETPTQRRRWPGGRDGDALGKRAAGHAIRPRRPPSCVSAAPPATHDQSIPTRLRFSLRWALLHTAARLLHALDAKLRRADLRRLQGGDAPGKPACETRALAPLACSALLLDLSCVASNSLALAMFPGANIPTYHTTNARPEPVVDSNGSDPCLAPPVRPCAERSLPFHYF